MNGVAFIDIQGFKIGYNKFILKEVYVNIIEENFNYHALINSPLPFNKLIETEKQQVQWLTYNYHGIPWESGNIPLTQFKRDMKDVLKDKTIICKGIEKLKWLQSFFVKISIKEYINCENLGCNINLSNHETCEHLSNICDYHNHIKKSNFVCALKNVIKLRRWYFVKYTNT